MKTQALTSALLKIPEIQTSVLWFIENYGEETILPWENYFKELYLDFDISLPANFDKADQQTFVGLTIINDYCLIPSKHPRTYNLFYGNTAVCRLDELEISDYVITNIGKLIVNLYELCQNNEEDKFYSWLESCVESWNKNKMVLQEQVLNLSADFSVPDISEIVGIHASMIYKIIQDSVTRIDNHQLYNLREFINKVNQIRKEYPQLVKNTSFLDFIIEEINNGGQHITEPQHLLPHFVGVSSN